MKRSVLSRIHNTHQGYLKDINGFPNELEFTINLGEAFLFRSMRQAKKWIMTRPAWILYSVERLDNNKRIHFKKWRKL